MEPVDFWPLLTLLLCWMFDLQRRLNRIERQPPVLIRIPTLTASQRRSD